MNLWRPRGPWSVIWHLRPRAACVVTQSIKRQQKQKACGVDSGQEDTGSQRQQAGSKGELSFLISLSTPSGSAGRWLVSPQGGSSLV